MNDIRKNMLRKSDVHSDLRIPGRRMAFWMVLVWAHTFFGSGEILGQRIDFTYRSYGLEIDSDNVIQNAAHLDSFFERLHQLHQGNGDNVNIVHLGDSHIQADYMTGVIRRSFHKNFGNAGRGLIVPLRVARTNEPNNFKTASKVNWNSKRCVFPDQPLPIGIGGVTIETTNKEADLVIHLNDLWLDYSFNSLTLFYEEDPKSFSFKISEPGGQQLGKIEGYLQDSTKNFTKVTWEKHVSSIRIEAKKESQSQSRAIIYGAVLGNSKRGVLYHTIGVNGAKFKHYNEAKHFAAQTGALQTDLFIISLGTNESVDYPHVDRNVFAQIDQLLLSLKRNNPGASFILVTPQDVYRDRNKPNPGISAVREVVMQYAVENGLAFYDLYRAMGGENSAGSWAENALLSTDGIHLTRDGYEYQGNLFYHALIKSYNSYVPNRNP